MSVYIFLCRARLLAGSAQSDRKVLLHLYKTTEGKSWYSKDGWAQEDADLGSWWGVTTNADGRVVKLELHKHYIERTPEEPLGVGVCETPIRHDQRGNNLNGEWSAM